MPLTINVDTYITQVDATTYIGLTYATVSQEYITWTALSSGDKDLYLRKACKKLDRQTLRGIKALATQTLEFPRAIRTDYYNVNYPNTTLRFTADWAVEESVSQAVKEAQVEEAITLATYGVQANKRIELQNQGVKSFSLGNLSENYGTGIKAGTTKLLSTNATELIRYYLLGAVGIV